MYFCSKVIYFKFNRLSLFLTPDCFLQARHSQKELTARKSHFFIIITIIINNLLQIHYLFLHTPSSLQFTSFRFLHIINISSRTFVFRFFTYRNISSLDSFRLISIFAGSEGEFPFYALFTILVAYLDAALVLQI